MSFVSKVLSVMIDEYEVDCDLNKKPIDSELLVKVRGIVARLSGKSHSCKTDTNSR